MAASDVIAWIDKDLVWNEEQIELQEKIAASLESGQHQTFSRNLAGEVDTTKNSLEQAQAAIRSLREGSHIMRNTRKELLGES